MRHLTEHERLLVDHLATLAKLPVDTATLLAAPMNDGGMGSLRFATDKASRFGSMASETSFEDEDGVYVLASLYLDKQGNLLELDVWKVDYTPLQRWPTAEDLRDRAVRPDRTP